MLERASERGKRNSSLIVRVTPSCQRRCKFDYARRENSFSERSAERRNGEKRIKRQERILSGLCPADFVPRFLFFSGKSFVKLFEENIRSLAFISLIKGG